MIVTRLLAALLIAATTTTAAPAPPWHGLPTRTTTHSHVAGDPVNIGIEGSQAAILAAFKRIGWVQADPLSPRSDLKMAEAAALSRAYPTAPVSNLYLFGRAEDFAVEHEIGATI